MFTGAFAHGPAAGRFLYLSWKREGVHEHPWGWRIKIPVAGIDWAKIRAAEKPGKRLAADVIGRGPHTFRARDLASRGFVKFARPDVPQNPSISVPEALIQIF